MLTHSTSWMKKDKMNQEKAELRIQLKRQRMAVTTVLSGHSDQDRGVSRGRKENTQYQQVTNWFRPWTSGKQQSREQTAANSVPPRKGVQVAWQALSKWPHRFITVAPKRRLLLSTLTSVNTCWSPKKGMSPREVPSVTAVERLSKRHTMRTSKGRLLTLIIFNGMLLTQYVLQRGTTFINY